MNEIYWYNCIGKSKKHKGNLWMIAVVPRAGVWIETIYYESIRNSKKDLIVNSFQRIVDFQRYTYRKCRNVFINEKELYGGAKRFESDYGMSSSFRRLCKGKLI